MWEKCKSGDGQTWGKCGIGFFKESSSAWTNTFLLHPETCPISAHTKVNIEYTKITEGDIYNIKYKLLNHKFILYHQDRTNW